MDDERNGEHSQSPNDYNPTQQDNYFPAINSSSKKYSPAQKSYGTSTDEYSYSMQEQEYNPASSTLQPTTNGHSSKYKNSATKEESYSDCDLNTKYDPLTSAEDYCKVNSNEPIDYQPTPAIEEDELINSEISKVRDKSPSSSPHKRNKHKHDKKNKNHSRSKSRSKHKSKDSDKDGDRSHKDKRKDSHSSSNKRHREEVPADESEESLDRRRSKHSKNNDKLVNSISATYSSSCIKNDDTYNGFESPLIVKTSSSEVSSSQASKAKSKDGTHKHHSSKDGKNYESKKHKSDQSSSGELSCVEKKGSSSGFGAALMALETSSSKNKKKKSKSHHKEKEKDDKKDKSHKSKSSHKESNSDLSTTRSADTPSSSKTEDRKSLPTISASSGPMPLEPISPNYKPLPHVPLPDIMDDIEDSSDYPTLDPNMFDQAKAEKQAENDVTFSKKSKRQIYSGRATGLSKVESLFDIVIRSIQENMDSYRYLGGVPYDILKPVIDRATAKQLFLLEHNNPYLLDSTNHLWEQHCKKEFKNKKPEDMETFRDMYIRLVDERKQKLKNLSEQYSSKQATAIAQRRTTQLAFVGTNAKPPKSVARAQAKYGTGTVVGASAHQSRADEIKARKHAMVNIQRAERSGVGPNARPNNAKKPKAPLMAKTMQFYKKTCRR